MEITQEQKLELGIQIVAGMKASAMGTDLETGMIAASKLNDDEKLTSVQPISGQKKEVVTKAAKEHEHIQAMFIAEVAISKLNDFAMANFIDGAKNVDPVVTTDKVQKDWIKPTYKRSGLISPEK